MGYLKIKNLYKDQTILLFKECWALEKVHGSSAHISFNDNKLGFFAGGESHERFISIFNQDFLLSKFKELFPFEDAKCVVFGEVYGAKCQGMRETYGNNLKFIAFDVKIGEKWLSVPDAFDIIAKLELEFVPYKKISTDLAQIDNEKDADSEVAIRRGMGSGKKREGVVLRPLVELTLNNGERVIAKHRRDEFRETKSPRPVLDVGVQKVLDDARAVAEEFATPMRLQHVLSKIPNHSISDMPLIINKMIEDINLEEKDEFVPSKEANKQISSKTAKMYKDYLKSSLNQ